MKMSTSGDLMNMNTRHQITIPDHTLGFFVPEPGPLRGKRSADRDLDRALFPDPLESDRFLLHGGIINGHSIVYSVNLKQP